MEVSTNFEKRISFDWFKFSSDEIQYNEDYKKVKCLPSVLKYGCNDTFLNQIFNLLNEDKHYKDYKITYKKESHFEFGVSINEGINASFFGPRIKNGHYQTLFNMSGLGCHYWSLSQKTDYPESWYNLFEFCRKNSFDYNRLDIAIDLIGGEEVQVFVDWLISKIKNGFAKTPYRYLYNDEHFSPNDGYSLYIGSPSGDSRFRLYNKNAEKKSKDSNAFLYDDCNWRLELQLTAKKVDMISDFINSYCFYFKNNDFNNLNQFVLNYFDRFLHIHLNDDINVSRCSVDPIWNNFISADKNIEFKISPKDKSSTYEIKKDWFNRSCGNILAMMFLVEDKNGLKNILNPMILSVLENADDIFFKTITNYYLAQGVYFTERDLRIKCNNLIESLKNDYV